MAKVFLTGLIQSISGKCGEVIFERRKGIIRIRPWVRPKNPKTKRQKQVRKCFGEINHKWGEISITDKALWEGYAKEIYNREQKPTSTIIRSYPPNPISGRGAFVSVNLVLMEAGFKTLERPPFNAKKPPTPLVDLKQFGCYKAPIKFNIWLPFQFEHKTIAQIWIKKDGSERARYLWGEVKVTEKPTQVEIDSIKLKGKKRKRKLKNLAPCEIKIQMRTIAENGLSSIPTHIYSLEVKP